MEEEKKGFVIKDKRLFDESGDVRSEKEEQPPVNPLNTESGRQHEASAAEPGETEEDNFSPEVNFTNFVFSLSTTAMYHFGDFPNPATNQAEKNLTAAKQTIDILGMLKSKTEGNLDENEKTLIDGLLFELRMRYVKEKAEG
jgi:hypothetical protein